MIDRLGGNRQPDLFVRTTSILNPNRIPARIQTEVASLLKLLMAPHTAADVAQRREAPMNKFTPEHLSRAAYVYVRQSTPDQLLNNPESRRRQFALETRARALGWENVIVIDEALDRSGGGTARAGFERLLAAICAGTAGAVFAIEASRCFHPCRWVDCVHFSQSAVERGVTRSS